MTGFDKPLLDSFKNHHLISTQSLTKKQLGLVLEATSIIERLSKQQSLPPICYGKILASLFFESSTRTRLSFESAMIRLGGQVITVENGQSTSVTKGERLEDTGAVISHYADVIVMRHSDSGSVETLSSEATIPVINAGDGSNEHPTQALLDLYTIFSEKQRIDNLKIGFVGDLRYGRTVHSLVNLLSQYNVSFSFISDPSLRLPEAQLEALYSKGMEVVESSSLSESIIHLDVLYATRVQKERFHNEGAYLKVKDSCLLTQSILDTSKSSLSLLHPLPRVNEISPEVDKDPKARYFKQAENGVYLRMALLSLILGTFEQLIEEN
jgi:aspartate carbamoyltransferase catalytic subunit